MDKKIITIICLSLIIISIAGVFAYNKVTEKSYKIGFQDATLLINNQLINNLKQNGFIIFNFPINETNYIPIKLVPQKSK